MPILFDLKKQGRIRYVGITTTFDNQYDGLISIMRNEPLDFIGVDYAIDGREVEREILPLAQERKIAVLAYAPFGRTRLFRRVSTRPLPEWAAEFDAKTWGQFFLKWVLGHPAITTVTPATSQAKNMLDNLGGAALQRNLEAMNILGRIVSVGRLAANSGPVDMDLLALKRVRVIGVTFRTRSLEELDAILVGLVDRVSRRLRAGERIGRTFTLRLRFGDFERATRSATIPRSTASTAAWIDTGRDLLRGAYPLLRARGCTLLGVTISGLVDAAHEEQLELDLWGRERRREESAALDRALDAVRDRFGTTSVGRAVLVGREVGFEAPQLPDRPQLRSRTATALPRASPSPG